MTPQGWMGVAAMLSSVLGLSCDDYMYLNVLVTGTATVDAKLDSTVRVAGELTLELSAIGRDTVLALDDVIASLPGGTQLTLESVEVDEQEWPVELAVGETITRTLRFTSTGKLSAGANPCDGQNFVNVTVNFVAAGAPEDDYLYGSSTTAFGPLTASVQCEPCSPVSDTLLGLPVAWETTLVPGANPAFRTASDLAVDEAGAVWVVRSGGGGTGADLLRITAESSAVKWQTEQASLVRVASGAELGVVVLASSSGPLPPEGGGGVGGFGGSGGSGGAGGGGSGAAVGGAGGLGGSGGSGGGGLGGGQGVGGGGGVPSSGSRVEVVRIVDAGEAWHLAFDGSVTGEHALGAAAGRVLVSVDAPFGLVLDGDVLDAAPARYLVLLDELTGGVEAFLQMQEYVTAVRGTSDGAFVLSFYNSQGGLSLSVVEPDLSPRWSLADPNGGLALLATGDDGSIFWSNGSGITKLNNTGQLSWRIAPPVNPSTSTSLFLNSLAWAPDGGLLLGASDGAVRLDAMGDVLATLVSAGSAPWCVQSAALFTSAGAQPGYVIDDFSAQLRAGRLSH